MVLSPDIAQSLAVPQQSRRAIIIRSAALFDQRNGSGLFQMIASKVPRGSKLRAPKPAVSPTDLAKRFLELKRLRQQVDELERSEAIEGPQIAARTDRRTGNDRNEP
jgi:hypothetical protein